MEFKFPVVDAWERSREEMILNKIARCREIELEARREILLLERQMAYGHVSPQPRDFLDASPMPEKDKLIVLVKPNPNISGAKRKAVEPPSLPNDDEKYPLVSTTELKDEWLCAICEANAPSEELWNQHLQGKKHIAMEKLIRNAKVRKIPTKEKDEIAGDLKSVAKEHGKRAFKYWCEMCKIGAFRAPVMEDHKKGKKHKRRLAEQEAASETTHVSQEVIMIRQKQEEFHRGETGSETTLIAPLDIIFPKQDVEF